MNDDPDREVKRLARAIGMLIGMLLVIIIGMYFVDSFKESL